MNLILTILFKILGEISDTLKNYLYSMANATTEEILQKNLNLFKKHASTVVRDYFIKNIDLNSKISVQYLYLYLIFNFILIIINNRLLFE